MKHYSSDLSGSTYDVSIEIDTSGLPPEPGAPGTVPGYIIRNDLGPYVYLDSYSRHGWDEFDFEGKLLKEYVGIYSYRGDGEIVRFTILVYEEDTNPAFLEENLRDFLDINLEVDEVAIIEESLFGNNVITISWVEYQGLVNIWVSDNLILLTEVDHLPEQRPFGVLDGYFNRYRSSIIINADNDYCGDGRCNTDEGSEYVVSSYCAPCEGDICLCEPGYSTALCDQDCTYGYCGDGACNGPEVNGVDTGCVEGSNCVECKDDCYEDRCDIEAYVSLFDEKALTINGKDYRFSILGVDTYNQQASFNIRVGEEEFTTPILSKYEKYDISDELEFFIKGVISPEDEEGGEISTDLQDDLQDILNQIAGSTSQSVPALFESTVIFCVNKELSLSCGRGVATEGGRVTIGTINTEYEGETWGRGWLYYGGYYGLEEPRLGYAMRQDGFDDDFDCGTVQMLGSTLDNKLSVQESGIICAEQNDNYALILPRYISIDVNPEDSDVYSTMYYDWYFNNNKGSTKFSREACDPNDSPAVCGDGVCEYGEDQEICTLSICPTNNPNCNVCTQACPQDCEISIECVDTDGGLNYFDRGEISGDVPPSFITEDLCMVDDQFYDLRETYCDPEDENGDGYKGTSKLYECPGSCEDGACVGTGLENYPSMYIDNGEFIGVAVIGDAANANDVVAAQDILGGMGANIPVGSVKLASEISDPYEYDLISIGGACVNAVTAEMMGNPSDCFEGLYPGYGTIGMNNEGNGKTQMVVMGMSDADTRRAANVLANYDNYFLENNDVCVSEDLGSIIVGPCPVTISTQSCVDSDGGQVFDIPGEVVVTHQSGSIETVADTCLSAYSVREMYCDGDEIGSVVQENCFCVVGGCITLG